MLTQYNLKMPHAVYGGENAMDNITAIIKARGASSAASAANAAIDHMHDWALGSQGIVSMGVYSDGSYGIQKGLIYSFPVVCRNGDWQIIQGRKISDFSRARSSSSSIRAEMPSTFERGSSTM